MATVGSTPTTQGMVIYLGNQQGQALNTTYSFVSVQGDTSGSLVVFGHLYQTNQKSAQLQAYYKLDGGAPIATNVFFPTDGVGTGNFAFSVAGMAPGVHTVVIEINTAPGAGQTYYINATASSDAGTGLSFTI